MTAASLQPPAWPRRRWLITVLLVLSLQLGLILLLSDRTPLSVRSSGSGLRLRLAGSGSAEVLALEDPTLFALPHLRGFSGPAWMSIPPRPARSFSWSEEPRPLVLSAADLGAAFNRFLATNDFNALQTPASPQPELVLPKIPPLVVSSTSSVLHIEGQLAQRRLLRPLALPPWPHSDLLTNSVVQIIVDADGRPVSKTLLSPSGYPPADQHALQQATAARFNSLDESGSATPAGQLTWGRLIFEWHTVSMPPTNASPAPAVRP
jgi:hypothetical protein